MKKNSIIFEHKSIDNVFDLTNFIKRLFKAEILFFSDTNEIGVAFFAIFSSSYLFKNMKMQENLLISQFLNGKSEIYECSKEEAFSATLYSPENFAKDFFSDKEPIHKFDEIESLINFLESQMVEIIFPEPEIINKIKLIDLDEREKRISQWKKILFDLVPYGVVVEDMRNETGTDSIFCVTMPNRAVPGAIAERNEHNDDYHDDDYIFFHPGENWIANYQEIIAKLELIYKEIQIFGK